MVEPDGTVRTVKYTADKENGFQAQVITNGKVVVHGNTRGSGSDESSSEGFTHEYIGSHSMEHGSIRHSSNSLSSGRSSSEEGYERSAEEDHDDDDEVDDDDDEDED